MQPVQNLDDIGWRDEKDLAGARGFEFIQIVADDPDYTSAFSCEMVRLGPNDHSVPHIEPWNHLLYFVEGTGELTVELRTWSVKPGSFAKVKAGQRHSLKNLGGTDMLILTVYDPPRPRRA